jgi:hypothetical protein
MVNFFCFVLGARIPSTHIFGLHFRYAADELRLVLESKPQHLQGFVTPNCDQVLFPRLSTVVFQERCLLRITFIATI